MNTVEALMSLGAAARGDLTPATDALADRVQAWLGIAMTKAKVRPVPDTDQYTATLPPFRKLVGLSFGESGALVDLRAKLEEWAKGELVAGRSLPTWDSPIPEVTPEARTLVRISHLRHLLRTRAKDWGGERQNLPAGAVERCLADIDGLVTRHAMQINGCPPAEMQPRP